MKKCPRCGKRKEEVGHYARDYTNLCSDCFAKGFVESLHLKSSKVTKQKEDKGGGK